jgi:hypothetical protein
MPSFQHVTETANASIDHFVALADIVLNASEELAALNINAARSACEFASAQAVPLTGEDVKEQISSRVAASGQGFEKAADYLRSVSEICAKTQATVTELSVKQAGEFAQSVQTMVEKVAKSAPIGAFDFAASKTTSTKPGRKAA